MKACGFPEELLSAYLDGEAGARTREVELHLEACGACRDTVAGWRECGARLVRIVDGGVGDVEPLVALSRIRTRIAVAEAQSPLTRLARWWRDLWMFRRRAAAGVLVAAALGALSSPLVVLWAGRQLGGSGSGAAFAGVVIESMEWGGKTQAVIYQGGSGATTLIWMEPDATKPDEPSAGNTP